jgi:O-antigen ligase
MNNLRLDKFSLKFKIITYIFISLPVLLITGPFLPDLGISIIGILFLYTCFKNKNFFYFNNIYFKIFSLFCLYIILNSILNNFSFNSLKIAFFYFRFGLFAIAIWFILKIDKNVLNKFYNILILSIIFLVIDGYIQYFIGKNIFGNIAITNRISSFFGDELILGSYLSRIFPILFAIFILNYSTIKKKKIIAFFLLYTLVAILIFLSGERASFFFFIFSSIFCLIFLKNFTKIILVALVISFLIISIITNFDENYKNRMLLKTMNEIGLSNLSATNNLVLFTPQHEAHYRTAFNMFKDNPLIGVGVKKFSKYCNNEKYMHNINACSTHPHNSYIQLLSETGLVGFSYLLLILFFFSFCIFKNLIYRLKGKYFFNDFEICLLSGILITIWPISTSGNFFNNWLSIIYYLPVGLLLWSTNKKKIFDK